MIAKLTSKLTVIIFCFYVQSFGQSLDSVIISPTFPEFFGTWFFVYSSSNSKDTLTFSRSSKASYGWGKRIEINKNGEFIDAYSAKCGNDGAIHHLVGKWTYDYDTKFFETTIPIDFKDKKYRITFLTADKLVFVKP